MIKAENVHKYFGSLHVLKGVGLSIEAGEIVSVVGRSGAGKSTLLQILGTLMTPDEGSVTVAGTDICSLQGSALSGFRNQKIGFVFQFHHLLPEFTALENVMMPGLIARAQGFCRESYTTIRERAESLIEEMGLSGRSGHKPSELSGGEQQRVAIARALVNNPAVLFADEPSGNLDSRNKEEIHNLFFRLRECHGETIVIVTHDSELARRSDRILEMQDGALK